jgi:hypothetical protein
MLDLVAPPNTIHFVVDRERSWKQTISLNSSQPVEKRTMKKKKRQLNKLHGISTNGDVGEI